MIMQVSWIDAKKCEECTMQALRSWQNLLKSGTKIRPESIFIKAFEHCRQFYKLTVHLSKPLFHKVFFMG